MRKRLTETSLLFIGALKCFVLADLTGDVYKNNGKTPIAVVPARLAAALVAISCGIYAGFYALSGPPAAGAINSQISENIISGGIFGSETAPYATVACLISFMMTGHRSVCPGQFVKGSKIGSDPEKSGPRNWAVPFGKKWKGKKGHDNTD